MSAQIISATESSNLTAIVVLSMILTPIIGILFKRFTQTTEQTSLENIRIAEGLSGKVLMIGFGRFGQVQSITACSRH